MHLARLQATEAKYKKNLTRSLPSNNSQSAEKKSIYKYNCRVISVKWQSKWLHVLIPPQIKKQAETVKATLQNSGKQSEV